MSHRAIVRLSAAALILTMTGFTVWAADSKEDIENLRTLTGARAPGLDSDSPLPDEVSIAMARRMFREAYPVRICYEGRPEIGRGPEDTTVLFRIRRNETLRHALDAYVASAAGLIEWEWINDILCIVPAREYEGEILSSFDAIVSLKLESVSAWEAFKALCDEIQQHNPTPYPFLIQPQCLGWVKRPPKAFTEDRSITLTVDGVTAREAACAILKAAPLEMQYFYVHGVDRDYLSLTFTENGKHIPLDHITDGEELDRWNAEIRSMRQPEPLEP